MVSSPNVLRRLPACMHACDSGEGGSLSLPNCFDVTTRAGRGLFWRGRSLTFDLKVHILYSRKDSQLRSGSRKAQAAYSVAFVCRQFNKINDMPSVGNSFALHTRLCRLYTNKNEIHSCVQSDLCKLKISHFSFTL